MSTRIWKLNLIAVGAALLLACGAMPAVSTPGTVPPAPTAAALVIDHTMTDLSQIPQEWLTAAKNLAFHFAHTSHGSQIITGLEWWETQRADLDVEVRYVVPPSTRTPALAIQAGNNYDVDN